MLHYFAQKIIFFIAFFHNNFEKTLLFVTSFIWENITTFFYCSSHGHVIGSWIIRGLFYPKKYYLFFWIASWSLYGYTPRFISSFIQENVTIFYYDHLISCFIDRKLAIYTEKSIIQAQRATAPSFLVRVYFWHGEILNHIPIFETPWTQFETNMVKIWMQNIV
jgi:hypothetical protein